MKKNRKFLSLFLSVLSCATLVSCGEGNKTSAPSNTGNVTTPSTPSTPTTPTTPSTPSAPSSKPSTDENNSSNEDEKKIYTIAELIAMMPSDGSATTERYYVRATIKSIDDAGFGAMTIEDPTGTLSVYGTYSADGAKRYSELDEKPVKGDTVLLYGTIQNYKNKTPEIKSGWIIEFTKGIPSWSEDDYTEMTIGEAREAAVGSLVKVTGVVSRITFADGMKPNGFIIVGDNSSIYVYDNQIAITVAIGNKITLLAKKTMYIPSKEASSAKKFGYKGACQLIDGHLLSNDEATNDLDLSFAQEKTVKEVIETSPSANITSLIYHSNALIKRVQKEGQNFVNYYIDDLDGKTGSYVYTACDGKDFAWMDQYDGKICSVYYTALNAKSTSTGVLFRFLPIKIEDNNNYQFDKAEAPKFAVEYYGLEQFDTVYSADPSKEMLTSVTSDLLNFGTATLSYSSNNTDLAYFETGEDGKVIFHINSGTEGTATITVTGHLDGQTDFSKTMDIKIVKPADVSLAVNVKAAIDASKDTELLVKGVIGPSLVNKNGFYLIDDSGSLAVVMNSKDEFKGLQIGQTVYIKGKRDLFASARNGNPTSFERCMTGCQIVKNEFGKVNYSTASFIKGKTLADLKKLSVADDYHTAEVYVITAGLKVVATQFSSNAFLKDGDSEMQLYCSNAASQYQWIKSYVDDTKTYTMEVAVCNWNNGSKFKACLLSITDSNGNKVMNTLNFNS